MKTRTFKIALACTGLLFLSFGCIKKTDPVKGDCGTPDYGNPPGDGGNNNPIVCNLTGKGTIEGCPMDPNTGWFINMYFQSGPKCPTIMPNMLVPVNLPSSFKQNANRVGFKYSYTGDSVQLNCGCFNTHPGPWVKRIKICSIWEDTMQVIAMKPVIYLYPEKKTEVNVQLNFQGKLTVTYPDYNEKIHGWKVMAEKDGSLKNLADNTEHQYLFWEGAPSTPYSFDMREGFCVKGSDTKAFLQKMLPLLGLTPKEYNDMIVFWLPKMMNNPYNLIHFAGDDYTQSALLNITPKPDNVLRVFMAFQPSKTYVATHEPLIKTPLRKGFTVVEWGGTEVPETAQLNSEKL
jgi:hypothetical protein